MSRKKRKNEVDVQSVKDLYTIIYTLIYKAASEQELSEYEFRIGYSELIKGSTAKKKYKDLCLSVKLDMNWEDDGTMDLFEEIEEEEGYEEQ